MSPSIRSVAWSRWKAFARRAAQVQAAVVLGILYYAVVVPIALCRPAARKAWRQPGGAPAWLPRNAGTTDITSARRQF